MWVKDIREIEFTLPALKEHGIQPERYVVLQRLSNIFQLAVNYRALNSASEKNIMFSIVISSLRRLTPGFHIMFSLLESKAHHYKCLQERERILSFKQHLCLELVPKVCSFLVHEHMVLWSSIFLAVACDLLLG